MSTNSTALAYQLEDLKQLDRKPFHKYPQGYLQAVKKRLTDPEYSTFLEIREESFKNYRNGGVVIKSAYEIAKSRDRSPRTIERHLSSIKAKGFIDLEQLKSGRGIYRRNHIQLSCPQAVLEEILRGSQDIVKPKQKDSTVYLCPTKMSEYSDKNAEHSLYNKIIDKSVINTNISDQSLITNLKQCFDEPEEWTDVPRETLSKVEPIAPIALIAPPIAPVSIVAEPEAHKTEGEVARFITKAERIEVVKKIKAMRKAGEMHASVQARYQDIMVLVHEIIFYCVYRDVLRRNFKHALNSAATGIRNGTWTTPRRLEFQRSQQRQRQTEFEKQREYQAYVGSGLGQMLGQAIRENYAGPSESDIANRKATVIEQGIQELGPNATVGQVQVLRDTVQQRFNVHAKAPNKPLERTYPTHEENIAWYSGLKDEDKMACYEYAVRKHAGFGMTLSSKGIDYRGAEFLALTCLTWFKQMMELIGRAK